MPGIAVKNPAGGRIKHKIGDGEEIGESIKRKLAFKCPENLGRGADIFHWGRIGRAFHQKTGVGLQELVHRDRHHGGRHIIAHNIQG